MEEEEELLPLVECEGNTPISAEQAATIAALRQHCLDTDQEWMMELASDLRLILEARKVSYDLELGKAYVADLAAWRVTNAPHLLTAEGLRDELSQDKAYWFGHDRYGHPTLWFRMCKHDGRREAAGAVQLVLYLLRLGLLQMRAPIEKFNIALDLADAAVDTSLVRTLIGALGRAFPGRCGRILVLNTGWFVRTLWAGVKVLLPARTVERIVFVRKDNGDHLAEIFTPRNLLAIHGGAVDAEFVYRGSVFFDPAPPARRAVSSRLDDETSSESVSCAADDSDDSALPVQRSLAGEMEAARPPPAARQAETVAVPRQERAATAAAAAAAFVSGSGSEPGSPLPVGSPRSQLRRLEAEGATARLRVDELSTQVRILEMRLRAMQAEADRKRSCAIS